MLAFLTPDAPTGVGRVCRIVELPDDPAYLALFTGALRELSHEFNWQQHGNLSPTDAATLFDDVIRRFARSDMCVTGTIFSYVTLDAPVGSIPCDGSTYAGVDYPALFAIIDPAYKHPDGVHFHTPDLRGRVVAGASQQHFVNSSAGADEVQLSTRQMPSHTHSSPPHAHSLSWPIAGLAVAPGELPVLIPSYVPDVVSASAVAVDPAGRDEPHNNIQPTLYLRYAMWV